MERVGVWFFQLRGVGDRLSADVEVAPQGVGGLLQDVGGLWKRLVGCFSLTPIIAVSRLICSTSLSVALLAVVMS